MIVGVGIGRLLPSDQQRVEKLEQDLSVMEGESTERTHIIFTDDDPSNVDPADFFDTVPEALHR